MATKKVSADAVLDRITELLTDLFIVEACRAGMGRDAIRKVLGVSAKRVSSVFMHVRADKG